MSYTSVVRWSASRFTTHKQIKAANYQDIRNKFDLGDEEESHPSSDPFRELLTAVLERAIRDMLGIKGVMPAEKEKYWRAEAWYWLEIGRFRPVDSPEPFSYQWICEYLNIDASALNASLTGWTHKPDSEKQKALHMKIRSNLLNYSFRLEKSWNRMKLEA